MGAPRLPAPLWCGWAGESPDTHSVFGIDVLAQGQEVLHDLHVPCANRHVQGGAQQLRREEAGTIGWRGLACVALGRGWS